MTREQIIAEIIADQARWRDVDPSQSRTGKQRILPEPVLLDQRPHLEEVGDVLSARLTQPEYLTCSDFDVFDVRCCGNCHNGYPHIDMWDVTLFDGQHAWVCDPFKSILMSRLHRPQTEQQIQLREQLENIFGQQDGLIRALKSAFDKAQTDDERIRALLLYEHYVFGRKRGDEPFEKVVAHTIDLLRTCVATAVIGYVPDEHSKASGSL